MVWCTSWACQEAFSPAEMLRDPQSIEVGGTIYLFYYVNKLLCEQPVEKQCISTLNTNNNIGLSGPVV